MDLKTIREEIEKRASGPITAPFVISWLLVNWELTFKVTSKLDLKEKIQAVNDAANWSDFLCPLFYSVIVTLALFFGTEALGWVHHHINLFWEAKKQRATLRAPIQMSEIPRHMSMAAEVVVNRRLPELGHRVGSYSTSVAAIDNSCRKAEQLIQRIEKRAGRHWNDTEVSGFIIEISQLRESVQMAQKQAIEITKAIDGDLKRVTSMENLLVPVVQVDRAALASFAARISLQDD